MPQSQLNSLPNYPVPLIRGGNTESSWYRFWAGLFQGLPPENVTVPTVGASPYTYSAVRKGSLIVEGGTVSSIEFSRDGTDFYDVGATAGMFSLNASDILRITYTGLPNVTFVPT
jgi:hypothetical protein